MTRCPVTINGATIAYGKFVTAVINFLIMAFIIFLLVKFVNKLMSFGKKQKEEEVTNKAMHLLL